MYTMIEIYLVTGGDARQYDREDKRRGPKVERGDKSLSSVFPPPWQCSVPSFCSPRPTASPVPRPSTLAFSIGPPFPIPIMICPLLFAAAKLVAIEQRTERGPLALNSAARNSGWNPTRWKGHGHTPHRDAISEMLQVK